MKTRIAILGIVVVLFIGMVVGKAVLYAADPAASVTIDTTNAKPRQVEELTEKALVREYTAAWQNLSRALKENNAGILQENFVGAAQQTFAKQIEKQKSKNISSTYIDRGHKVDVMFYSPEGSAIQFRDTANLELQVLDGGKVIYSEPVQQQYVGVMTVTGDRWKVRVLQATK
ncbi:MAG TPA: hypothetical protein VM009_05280 [Terriglobales bacterium]|nr:hypothetical protein [Terriglobales bacterium]